MAMNKSLGEMLRFVSTDESQALQDICEYNDINEEQLVVPENITNLEMFLFNFTRICCMTFFPNLTSLSLVQQNLRVIEGLHCLPHLKILRLSENEIQRIEGLSNCLKLKEVFLQNNKITRITNLSHLSGLRVLWLANNYIKWVEGLDNLQIKELNLAKNPLCQLGNILKLKTLKYLNVSGTNIGSFKEIGNLTRLKKLKDLRFSDPHWGPSPLAMLHNYQTYILFRLQELQKLDTLDLTDEAKRTAKVTYTRKRVYYNLCIKSLQQSRNNKNNFVIESQRIKGLQKKLTQHIKASRDMEKSEVGVASVDKFVEESSQTLATQKHSSSKSKAKTSIMTHPICTLIKRIDYLNKDLHLSRAREKATINLNIHWLMVELDSGGNIRMELGNPTDVWYKSCVDLVLSRFFLEDYAPFGIVGINVNKVTRIHNRFLQDRFERQHDHQILKSGNKNVEYLLCGETLQLPDELQCIVEGGFPLSPHQVISGGSMPIVLSNSVGLADCCRLKIFADHPNSQTPRGRSMGWVLVVKTCLGTCVKDVRCKHAHIPCKKDSNIIKVDGEGTIVKKSSYPHVDSVYRSHPTDSKQRSWFVFDATTVVPEYLVEFEYCFTNEISSGLPVHSYGGVTDLLEKDKQDLCTIFDPDSSLPSAYDLSFVSQTKSTSSETTIQSSPSYVQPNELVTLSIDFILRKGCVIDLQSITYLNFHDNNLSDIDALRGLCTLKILILSFNKISKIVGLGDLASLERLDMSYNLLKNIEGFNGLSALTTLDLGGNQIWKLTELAILQCQVPGLLSLNLRANPIVDDLDYRMMVLRTFSSLVELDNNSILPEEHVEANIKYISSPAILFSEWIYEQSYAYTSLVQEQALKESHLENDHSKCQGEIEVGTYEMSIEEQESSTTKCLLKRLDDPFRLSPYNISPCKLCPMDLLSRFDLSKRKGDVCAQHQGDDLQAWYDDVEEVHLERHKLKTMHCFDRLSNLRRLFLSENNISKIEGLDNCNMLEELLLDDNHIKQVVRVKYKQALWRLDLSRNNLTCCGEIGSFQALEQLSIDCNQIQSLKGLDVLISLMELYAANNLIVDVGEVNHLKNLTKLIVVDLSGNKLCDHKDYRMYTIYTLRKLKVLDGRNVETNELTFACHKYLGRLTQDMLEHHIDHCNFSKLEVIDLSGQKLRSCGEVFESGELRGLRELNLNDNLLCSIHALRFLANLKVLQLENNSFEDKPLFEGFIDNIGEFASPDTSLEMADIIRSSIEKEKFDDCISLPSLEILKLGGNAITNISSLCMADKFPKLKLLALHDNKIAKVDGLEGLTFLEKLYLDHNEIRELDPLSFTKLSSLRVFSLSNNGLKTLAHLNGLVTLEFLDLASNHISPNRMGGLASIENLSRLPNLSKLSFINNPISRQNLYRIFVVSRLLQLHFLDDREITEEERQEAKVYAAGNKEPTSLLIDTNAVLDYHSSSPFLGNGSQLKIPLKVTSLNFESMCLQQSPRGTYQITNPSKSRITVYNHVPNFVGMKTWDVEDPKHQSGVLRRCFDKNQQLVQGNGKGENKVIMIPYSTYVKSLGPAQE